MQNEDQQSTPKPATSGSMKPPRPPHGTVVAAGSDGDDSGGRTRKEIVRINLPRKPISAATIKLPKITKGTK
jgi:hypothetical protein